MNRPRASRAPRKVPQPARPVEPLPPPLPLALLDHPLDYFLSEHHRHRIYLAGLRQAATAGSVDREAARRLFAFLAVELPLHWADEKIDLLPCLLRLARPEDGLDEVLARLDADQAASALAVGRIMAGLSEAMRSRQIEHLKVRHVIVCGHYGCGGGHRAMIEERGAMLDHWLQPLTMLCRKHRPRFDRLERPEQRLDRLCEINIEMQVRRLAASPLVENAWRRGQELHLHGWIYGIHDGLLRDLCPHLSTVEERDALPSIDARVMIEVESVSGIRRHAVSAFEALPDEALADCPCHSHSTRPEFRT